MLRNAKKFSLLLMTAKKCSQNLCFGISLLARCHLKHKSRTSAVILPKEVFSTTKLRSLSTAFVSYLHYYNGNL